MFLSLTDRPDFPMKSERDLKKEEREIRNRCRLLYNWAYPHNDIEMCEEDQKIFKNVTSKIKSSDCVSSFLRSSDYSDLFFQMRDRIFEEDRKKSCELLCAKILRKITLSLRKEYPQLSEEVLSYLKDWDEFSLISM